LPDRAESIMPHIVASEHYDSDKKFRA